MFCFLFMFVLFYFIFFRVNFHSLPAPRLFFYFSLKSSETKRATCLFSPVSVFLSSNPLLLNSSSAFLRYFSLNQSSGVLTVRQNTPAGSYWLRVGVSDGVWPDVISGVRVHVRELEEKAILSSASLRLTGNFGRNTDSPDGINTC